MTSKQMSAAVAAFLVVLVAILFAIGGMLWVVNSQINETRDSFGDAVGSVGDAIGDTGEAFGDVVTLDFQDAVKVHHESVVEALTEQAEFVGARTDITATQEYRTDGVLKQTQTYRAAGWAEASISFDNAQVAYDETGVTINLPKPKLHAAVLETETSGAVEDRPGTVCGVLRRLGQCDEPDEQQIRVDGEQQIFDTACQETVMYQTAAMSAVQSIEMLTYSPDVPVTVLVDGVDPATISDWLTGVCP